MSDSPTSRSLKYLREGGWEACIVEKYNRFARVRQDAFGFGDILAFNLSRQIALVQTTTMTNMGARRKKILANKAARHWPGLILLHGWRKIGARGKRKTWKVAEEAIDFND